VGTTLVGEKENNNQKWSHYLPETNAQRSEQGHLKQNSSYVTSPPGVQAHVPQRPRDASGAAKIECGESPVTGQASSVSAVTADELKLRCTMVQASSSISMKKGVSGMKPKVGGPLMRVPVTT
jgi:hypothetical protein